MFSIIQLYKNAYGGLSRNSWMLSLIMFINRSGSMVLPFMSVYLTDDLNLSKSDAGILMAAFGVGSMLGTFMGGYLTDKIGHFHVQFLSLTLGGVMFFILLFMKDFYSYMIVVFLLSTILQSLPPANASSVSFYSKPENVTRSFALNRMAMNLGFVVGPTVGGILILISYDWLFIADGLTCILAGLVFYFYFRNKSGHKTNKKETGNKPSKSPFSNMKFLGFIFMCSMFATCFFQLFSTLPLYYKNSTFLSDTGIGILLALNGMIVFSCEMLVVYRLKERKNLRPIIITGIILMAIAFFLLNISTATPILILSMVVLSFAEIFAMPFLATVIVNFSDETNRGRYMGFYTFSYSIAFVLAPLIGTNIAEAFNFGTLWWVMGFSSLLVAAGLWLSMRNSPANSK